MVTTPELRTELLARVVRDQLARRGALAGDVDAETARQIDAENMAWLSAVLDRTGWPASSLVGAEGANAAWLIAQHADLDPAFQRRCLDLLVDAVEAGEATVQQLAYLTDRVLLKEQGRQIYATQCALVDGELVPDRLDGPDGVDERRAAVGLGPLTEYLGRMKEFSPESASG